MTNTALSIIFLLSFITITFAELPLQYPTPPSTSPIPPSTACNSTPDPSFCRTILPPNGTQPLYSYGQFSIAKSLANARKFLSLISRHLAHKSILPAQIIGALQDCYLLADLNIDFLVSANSALTSYSADLPVGETEQLHALLSALVTNQQTCLDGLQYADKKNAAAGELSPSIVNGTKLYSVSLALFARAWVPRWRLKKTHSLHHFGKKLLHTPPTNARHLLFHQVEMGKNSELPLRMSENNKAVIEGRLGRRLLQTPNSINVRNVVVVSRDGLGNFTTINDAVASAPNNTDVSDGYYLIFVMAGVYQEYVSVPKNKRYIMMIGDGNNQTVLTGNHSVVDGWTTFNSATLAVVGQGFVAINMTFQNTAGPSKHQAVAVRNGADLSTFYRCTFDGFQDTLYSHSMRQFFTECAVYGTVDYIFGNSAVVLQNCSIFSRLPSPGQKNTVTAQGRTDPNQNTGISIQGGRFLAAGDLTAGNGSTQTYLGRPWKEYSRTVIMSAFMDSLIQAAGWLPWDGDFALDTLYYAEYDNNGPGSNTSGRVRWAGYHVLNSSTDAVNFTVGDFILGDNWLPLTGVPYTSGLF